MISFSEKLRVLFSVFLVVEGTLIPNGTVSLDCGSQQTFTCSVTGVLAGWTISGLDGISVTSQSVLIAANSSTRITTTDTSGTSSSTITIDGFTTADDGGIIECFDIINNNVQGMSTVRVGPLPPPSNTTATTVSHDCTVITLQWDKPDIPSDITSAVSCTPSSTSCGACTSSPCNITGLELNTDYNFTVTLNSGMCGTSMDTTVATAKTLDVPSQLKNVDAQLINGTSVQITWDQPSNNPPVTSVNVTCMPSSLNCGPCPPSGPCTISGLDSNTTYNFTVTPNNNCGPGSASSASATAPTPPPTPGLPIVVVVVPIVAAIILVVLVVSIVIVVVIWCMKKKHGVKACPCIEKKENKKGGDGDVIYEDPEKNNDNIKMQSSPAYQTVSSVCATKGDYYYYGMTDDVKMEPSPAYQTVS